MKHYTNDYDLCRTESAPCRPPLIAFWRTEASRHCMFEWRPPLCTARTGWKHDVLERNHSDANSFCVVCSFRNAYAIALFLESHKGVTKVLYPGLPSHPQHDIAKRQQLGFGAMISFFCTGGRAQSAAILQNVRIHQEATAHAAKLVRFCIYSILIYFLVYQTSCGCSPLQSRLELWNHWPNARL